MIRHDTMLSIIWHKKIFLAEKNVEKQRDFLMAQASKTTLRSVDTEEKANIVSTNKGG